MVKREIEIMRMLKHDNIVELNEVYETKKNIFLVMGYCNLTDLSNLKAVNDLKGIKFKDIFYQILTGVKYLQENGVVHRDIKPENLMLNLGKKGYRLKLIDFGLSTSINSENSSGELKRICGTPGSIAPEILEGSVTEDQFFKKCDVYSIGAVFFYMVCGSTAIEGNEFNEIFENNKKGIINFSELYSNNTDPELINLIKKMLKKSPEERISIDGALNHSYFLKYKQNSKLGNSWSFSTNTCEKITELKITKKFDLELINDIEDEDLEECCERCISDDIKKMEILNQNTNFKNKFNLDQKLIERKLLNVSKSDISFDDDTIDSLSTKIKTLKTKIPKLIEFSKKAI